MLAALTLAAAVSFLAPRPAVAAITGFFETPEDGSAASGVGVIRGWAFAPTGKSIKSVELFVDGTRVFDIPCCSERRDVANAFPQEPNALMSGFGGVFSYGLMSRGSHVVSIKVTDSTGAALRMDHTVEAVKPPTFDAVGLFDLSGATAFVDGEHIVVRGIRIRDRYSDQADTVEGRFRWSVSSQALGMSGMMTAAGKGVTVEVNGMIAPQGTAAGQGARYMVRAHGTNGKRIAYRTGTPGRCQGKRARRTGAENLLDNPAA